MRTENYISYSEQGKRYDLAELSDKATILPNTMPPKYITNEHINELIYFQTITLNLSQYLIAKNKTITIPNQYYYNYHNQT
jgi:hypothetical protein